MQYELQRDLVPSRLHQLLVPFDEEPQERLQNAFSPLGDRQHACVLLGGMARVDPIPKCYNENKRIEKKKKAYFDLCILAHDGSVSLMVAIVSHTLFCICANVMC